MKSSPEKTMDRGVRNARLASKLSMFAIAAMLILPVSAGAVGPIVGVKVKVKQAGFHRVTVAQIATALSTTQTAVASMPLHVENLGLPVASIRDNGDVIFFGKAYDSIYTDENIYWILPGAIGVEQAAVHPATGTPQDSFIESVMVEQQLLIRSDLVTNPSDDPWLWRQLTSGLSTKQYITGMALPGLLAGTGGDLTIRVKGLTDTSGKYYHGVRVTLNGTVLGTANFEGLNSFETTFPVPPGVWIATTNSVKVESIPPAGTSFDSFCLDRFESHYSKRYDAIANRLVMKANAGGVRITGLNSSAAELWDVSDPWHAKMLTGYGVQQDGSAWAIDFDAPHAGAYAVSVLGSERAPDGVMTAYGNDLKQFGNSVDYLVVAGAGMENGAQTLANYRTSKGLSSKVVTMESVYDSFNYGIRDGRALKAMLSYAYRMWSKGPRYVLLIGDGSLDYRNYLAKNDSSIPTPPVADIYGMFASDHTIGDITGDGYLDIAVGRLPVNNTNELSTFITKLVAFENGGNWRDKVLISTDDRDNAGVYIDEGNTLAEDIVGKTIERADIEMLGAAVAHETLTNGVANGRDMSIYIGHGSSQLLAEEGLMTIPDVQSMTNSASSGIFVALGCLAGTYGAPGVKTIGESLVTGQGGASTMIGAATYVTTPDSTMLAQELLTDLYENGDARIGDAWVFAKNAITENGRLPAALGYQLLGDPATGVGSVTAPPGGPVISPSRGTYEEWRTWAFGPTWSDSGLPTDINADADGDGLNNGAEFTAGTDPTDAKSRLMIVRIKPMNGGQVEVRWPCAPGRSYRVEKAMVSGLYQSVADDLPATQPENGWVDTTVGASQVVLYRIVAK